ncbi:MAG: right-handed parallel beta-helix repeat-containing protein, partial [Candidatus Thorarchaeota archaeon]
MKFSGTLTAFLLLIGMSVIAVQANPITAIHYSMSIDPESSFTPTSNPITITSEMDFLSHISSGNGSESNPYVIEDLMILTDGNGIEVRDTQTWFEIRNCTISSDTRGLNGVYCHNVTNAAIVNCTITNMLDGVYFEHSQSCQVLSSSLSYTEAHGVRVEICSEVTISDNLAFENDDDGIFFTGRNRGSVISFNTV